MLVETCQTTAGATVLDGAADMPSSLLLIIAFYYPTSDTMYCHLDKVQDLINKNK